MGRRLAAAHFKKKMAKEITDMVYDHERAKEFLGNVRSIKGERKKRNLHALVANSTNPDKEETDFIRVNIDEFHTKEKEEEKYLS